MKGGEGGRRGGGGGVGVGGGGVHCVEDEVSVNSSQGDRSVRYRFALFHFALPGRTGTSATRSWQCHFALSTNVISPFANVHASVLNFFFFFFFLL